MLLVRGEVMSVKVLHKSPFLRKGNYSVQKKLLGAFILLANPSARSAD